MRRRGGEHGPVRHHTRHGRIEGGQKQDRADRELRRRSTWRDHPSADLAAIVGKDDLPRREVVSKVWDYIKKHDLQDAKDRRRINADDKLAKVFGGKSASKFEMAKLLSAHLTARKR